MKRILWLLLLSSVALFAADVSGRWSGTMEVQRDGGPRTASALFILKQDGGTIAGSVGPNMDEQIPILKGRRDDTKLMLEVEPPNNTSKVTVELTLDGDDHMTGQASGEGEQGKFTVKFDLKREK